MSTPIDIADDPTAVDDAIEILGSQQLLADACDVSQSAVSQWTNGGTVHHRNFPAIVGACAGKLSKAGRSVTLARLLEDEIRKTAARDRTAVRLRNQVA